MSGCFCNSPTSYRATGENTGDAYLYLRCAECGGKVGRVHIDMVDLFERVTDPDEVEERISIHFDQGDSPFMW